MGRTLPDILADYADLPEFVGLGGLDVGTVGNFGSTPLHVAAIRGDLEEVRILIDSGAPLDVRGEHGYTPLHEAAEQGHLQVCMLLLARGASTTALNDDGESPSEVAKTDLARHLSREA